MIPREEIALLDLDYKKIPRKEGLKLITEVSPNILYLRNCYEDNYFVLDTSYLEHSKESLLYSLIIQQENNANRRRKA